MAIQDVLQYAEIAFFVAAAVCLVIAIAVFFLKDIRGIRNYLTGKTMREAIERMGTSGARSERGRRKTSPPGVSVHETSSASKSGEMEGEAGSGGVVAPSNSPQETLADASSKHQQPATMEGASSKSTEATTVLREQRGETAVLHPVQHAEQGSEPKGAGVNQEQDAAGFAVVKKIVLTASTSRVSFQ